MYVCPIQIASSTKIFSLTRKSRTLSAVLAIFLRSGFESSRRTSFKNFCVFCFTSPAVLHDLISGANLVGMASSFVFVAKQTFPHNCIAILTSIRFPSFNSKSSSLWSALAFVRRVRSASKAPVPCLLSSTLSL